MKDNEKLKNCHTLRKTEETCMIMDWIPDQGETAIKDSTETTGDT